MDHIFQAINKDNNGEISESDLKIFFSEQRIEVTSDDIHSLISRYHKGVGLQINYTDFIQELTPKLYH